MNRSRFVLILSACLALTAAVPMASGVCPDGASQATPAQIGDGYVYDFGWSGDKYIQSNGVNETWFNEPMSTNWFGNDSLGLCWNWAVQPGLRVQTAEIYLQSSGNMTLWVDWLQDSCDDVTLLLWNFVTDAWVQFWRSDNCQKDSWIEQSFALTAAYDNGSVLVRWELAKDCVGNTGNWIPALYIDFATLYDSTDPPPISPLSDYEHTLDLAAATTEHRRVQVGTVACVNWTVTYDGEMRVFCDGVNVANTTPTEDYTLSYTFVPDEMRVYKFWLYVELSGHPVIDGYQEIIGDSVEVWYHTGTPHLPITDIGPIRTAVAVAMVGSAAIIIGAVFMEKREQP